MDELLLCIAIIANLVGVITIIGIKKFDLIERIFGNHKGKDDNHNKAMG